MSRIINLSKTYGIDESCMGRLLSGIDEVKSAYDLFDSVIELAIKNAEGTQRLLEYLVEQLQAGI